MAEANFKQLFENAYGAAKAEKAVRSSTIQSMAEDRAPLIRALGHPDYQWLQIGQTSEAKALVFFLDVRGFTRLSFVYPNEELVRILQALSAASVRSIEQFGGHVSGFTGDGVMAIFANSAKSSEESALSGLHCAAFLMKGIREVVNPILAQAGTDPIRVGVGMEFGDVLWTRIGVPGTSEVKPISEVTFLAGKLCTSKYCDAWQAKVGENLAFWIPDEFKKQARRYEWSLNGKIFKHELFVFDWEEFAKEYQADFGRLRTKLFARQLGSRMIPAARVLTPATSNQPGPRSLKDQPFF